MSYDIVRGVRVDKDGAVHLKTYSNNVWPRTPEPWTMTYRHEQNPFTGKLAGEVEVLAGYEQGNLQGGSNKYTRQLEVLRHMPEYRAYDWRGHWDETRDAREHDKRGYYELLAKALATPAPKPRFAITKTTYSGQVLYFQKRKGAGFCRWSLDIKGCNLYRYAEDAEAVKHNFNNSESWKVTEI